MPTTTWGCCIRKKAKASVEKTDDIETTPLATVETTTSSVDVTDADKVTSGSTSYEKESKGADSGSRFGLNIISRPAEEKDTVVEEPTVENNS